MTPAESEKPTTQEDVGRVEQTLNHPGHIGCICVSCKIDDEVREALTRLVERLRSLEYDLREVRAYCRFGHYCTDWDGMWVHQGMEAFDACLCDGFGKGHTSLPTRLRELEGGDNAVHPTGKDWG